MANETVTTPKILEFKSGDRCGELFRQFRMLAILAEQVDGHGIGMPEADLVKQSGLSDQEALRCLASLEREKIVHSQLNQEGTAGPYARRYRLNGRSATMRLELGGQPIS
ncbi:MAG: hypothetical protein HYZ63_01090 [Candidatus Andersenbacteria bacterium]|nr:hypothetical protein [Candidatus Andersenbacteria bacterium]